MKTSRLSLLIFVALVATCSLVGAQDMATEAESTAMRWINVIGIALLGGAGCVFIYACYEAFHREWTKCLIALLVVVILGLAPKGLGYVAKAWGFKSNNSDTPTFLKSS